MPKLSFSSVIVIAFGILAASVFVPRLLKPAAGQYAK